MPFQSGSVLPLTDLQGSAGLEKWQQILADLVTEPKELLHLLDLTDRVPLPPPAVLAQFPLKVPRPFIARMQRGNPDDPLLRQVLPLTAEAVPGGVADPLDERHCNPAPGLLHKYTGRVLLTAAPHCAVHCRYCFRREFDYTANTPGRAQWQAALDHIAADPQIHEAILSGGDPLAAGDRHLAWLVARLAEIPHLQRLRIHTRTPIVIPQRVTDGLLQWLTGTRLQPVMVLHSNHAQEIDADVGAALNRLADAGVPLLNQSVLLRGVNDSVATLKSLSEVLFSHRVLPYYLHLLDPVTGAGHFDVPEPEARALMAGMRAVLPGYLVPRLVREIPGRDAKTVIA